MIAKTAARLLLIVVLAASSGCATVIKGTGRDVTFTSTPKGAQIFVDGKFVGKTPVIAKVSHGKDKQVEAKLPGYLPRQAMLTTSFSGHSLWLMEFSLLVDLITGSIWTVDNGLLHLDLEPIPGMASAEPGAPQAVSQPTGFATAQPGSKRLAVLEFQGKNLDQDILMTLSDAVRGGVLQGLEGRGITVMTRENMLVLLKDMGKQECGEGDCEVETARNIGADYVISGKVVRIETTYVVTLKLHETKGGSLIGSDTVEAKSQVELMHELGEHSRKLVTSRNGARGPAGR